MIGKLMVVVGRTQFLSKWALHRLREFLIP